MSAVPKFSMHELLEAGVHFGHRTMRWNPHMKPYIYGERGNIHIINLQKTVPMLHTALRLVHEVVARNGRVLFVGTKRQASDVIAQSAKRCSQYYVNHRWLGGMLTNWSTVSQSIKTLKSLEEQLSNPLVMQALTKKEQLDLARKREKLDRSLGGIRDMGGRPDLLFVVDINKESLAIDEARRLGIPIVAVVDSNCDPFRVDYPIPGNDDAVRAIELYCRLISDASLSGIERALEVSGVDIGASSQLSKEATAEFAGAFGSPETSSEQAALEVDAGDDGSADSEEDADGSEKKAAAKKAPAKKPASAKTATKRPSSKKAAS